MEKTTEVRAGIDAWRLIPDPHRFHRVTKDQVWLELPPHAGQPKGSL